MLFFLRQELFDYHSVKKFQMVPKENVLDPIQHDHVFLRTVVVTENNTSVLLI